MYKLYMFIPKIRPEKFKYQLYKSGNIIAEGTAEPAYIYEFYFKKFKATIKFIYE